MTTDPIPVQEKYFYTRVIHIIGNVFSNKKGRFPVKKSRGQMYIMKIYEHNSNAILAKVLKSEGAAEKLAATTKLHMH